MSFQFFLGETNSSFLFLCLLRNILQLKPLQVKNLMPKFISGETNGEWKKQLVWFRACFPAASQAACFYFPSIRTGLSCLCRNLSKTIAHWQNSFQSILSQTSTLQNIFLKTVLFTNTVNLPVESLLQQHLCLAQGFLKTFLVLFATKQDLLGFVYQVLSDLCWF